MLAQYRLEEVLGQGGMGVVYLAFDTRLERKVAVKIMAPALASDDAFRQRFEREARMAAAIDHPNIIPIHDTGEFEGVLYLAMRYVPGTDLRTLLVDVGALPWDRAVSVLRQVASALDAAHAEGLVHRDVKPANVLMAAGSGTEEADHVYLTDFGLTKRFSQGTRSLTATGQFVGTIDYVAPEQVENRIIDGRADQYSLGCVMFECLTGAAPFAGTSDVATLFAHVHEPAPLVSGLRPELPPEVDQAIEKAMAKSPEDRYDSCVAFVVAVRDALRSWSDSGRTIVTGPAAPTTPAIPTATAAPPPPPPVPTGAIPGASSGPPWEPPMPADSSPPPPEGAGATHVAGPPALDRPPPATDRPSQDVPPPVPPPDGGRPAGGAGPKRRFLPMVATVAWALLVAGGLIFVLTLGGDEEKKGVPPVESTRPSAPPSNDVTPSPDVSATTPPAAGFTCADVSTTDLADPNVAVTQIFVMNNDGSEQVRISTGSVDQAGPTFAPDCTQVAFAQEVDGNKDIYLMDPDGSNVTRLTTDAADDGGAEWSPDGSRILWAGKKDPKGDLYTIAPDGSGKVKLTEDPGSDLFPAWSFDGKQIVWSSSRAGDLHIFVMRADGTGVRQITGDATQSDQDPALNPDGTKIAFSAKAADGTRQIFRVNVDGTGLTQLTGAGGVVPGAAGVAALAAQQVDPGSNVQPEYSPNGQHIVFTSTRDGNEEIYVMNPDGTGQRRLTDAPGDDTNAEYSKDGTKIIWDRSPA
jgi:serine/threonine-protein kinase